jgi:hypothetical protein
MADVVVVEGDNEARAELDRRLQRIRERDAHWVRRVDFWKSEAERVTKEGNERLAKRRAEVKALREEVARLRAALSAK